MGVAEGWGVIEAVTVGGTLVSVGIGELVTMNVEVAEGMCVQVAVGGTMVTPGVLVGTFGTHKTWPT